MVFRGSSWFFLVLSVFLVSLSCLHLFLPLFLGFSLSSPLSNLCTLLLPFWLSVFCFPFYVLPFAFCLEKKSRGWSQKDNEAAFSRPTTGRRRKTEDKRKGGFSGIRFFFPRFIHTRRIGEWAGEGGEGVSTRETETKRRVKKEEAI